MRTQKTWERARELGLKEGERNMLLRLLRARFGELPAVAVARIEAGDTAAIERWVERLHSAETLAEVLSEPS